MIRKTEKILRFVLALAAFSVGLATKGAGQGAIDSFKLTPAARNLLNGQASREVANYWLYLDSSAVDVGIVHLSERSLARRAKVDPVNFLIDWRDYAIADSVFETLSKAGLRPIRSSRWLKAVAVEADFAGVTKAIALPFVRKIDPVKTLKRVIDDDILQMKPLPAPIQSIEFDYGLALAQNQFVNAIKLHRAGITGNGVLIAILDSGFEVDHPVFDSADIVATYDFINDDPAVDDSECPSATYNDQNFHGTSVFSVIGANVPGTLIGVAPGASFLLAKTEITCNSTEIKIEEYNWVAACEWADSAGADIINSSLGYTIFTDSGSYAFEDLDGNTAVITNTADMAAAKNILVVNSAGNERNSSWGHIVTPADGDSVLAVGAVYFDSNYTDFSSPGPTADGQIKPDITTLGAGVSAAWHLGGYATVSGTSYSAPLTSGAAALIIEKNPSMTAMEVLDRIKQSGSRATNPDNDYGWGILNASLAANLFIALDLPPKIQMAYDRDTVITVAAVDLDGPLLSLNAVTLPVGATFVDNEDNTGRLEISPNSGSSPLSVIRIEATDGNLSDTAKAVLEIFGRAENVVSAGPNPFRDEVNIFINTSSEIVQSISFFNMAGEIVWEKVNNFATNADATYGLLEQWNGHNQHGEAVAAGVYILVVVTDRQTYHVKLLKTN